jgi:hypothetical protein
MKKPQKNSVYMWFEVMVKMVDQGIIMMSDPQHPRTRNNKNNNINLSIIMIRLYEQKPSNYRRGIQL